MGALNSGDYSKGVRLLTQVVRQEPGFARGWSNRGACHRGLGDSDQALEDYAEALRVDPWCASAFANRAMLWIRAQQYDLALLDQQTA